MTRSIFFGISILAFTVSVFAQPNPIPERLLISTGQYMGSGARPMGLGGTYTGVGDDFTAVWYNPAGIAQVKRIELQASLSRSGFVNDATYYGQSRDGSTSNIRLNNFGFVFPVPVYKGALSFALGYNQLVSFDRRTRIEAPEPIPPGADWHDFDELESGRLGIWNLSGAVDVSPNLSLGLGLNYWRGLDDYTFTGYDNQRNYTESTVQTRLSGFMTNFGGLLRVGRYARAGVMFQPAMSMLIEEDWSQDQSSGFDDYRMTYPAVFRGGVSFSPGRWLLAGDLEYRDWNTMEFRTDPPFVGVTRTSANQEIKNTYGSTTRLSFGGEYLFPVYGIRVRAGYAFEPTNFKVGEADENHHVFSLGAGVLVDRSVMLDIGYRRTTYREMFTPGLTEDIRSSTALVTMSYRM